MLHYQQWLIRLVILVLATPSLLFAQGLQREGSTEAQELAITGATLIDGTGAAPQTSTTILVRDGRIAAVTPDADAEVPAGVREIDAAGKYVMPGLADMHVHFGRGGGLPNTPEATERVLRQFLFYGVTSVLNLGAYYGRPDQILELRQRREAGEILAPHIYATGGLLTVPGSHPINSWARRMPDSVDVESYDWSERGVWVVRTPEEVREVVRRMAAAGMDGIKVVIESEVLLPPYDEESPQMPLEMVRAAVEEAHQHELPAFAHISDPDELEAALDAGVDAVVHFGGEPPGPELVSRMEQQQMYLVPTLSAYIFADTWGDSADNLTDPFLRRGADEQVIESVLASPLNPTSAVSEEDWAWRRDYLAALKATHDAGVMLVGGSDPPAGLIFHGYNMHHELELMVEAGLTPMEALVAATSRAAEMIGEGDVFGTIEPGKRADMLILEADPLEDIRNTRTLEAVILDGKVIDRSSPFPDE